LKGWFSEGTLRSGRLIRRSSENEKSRRSNVLDLEETSHREELNGTIQQVKNVRRAQDERGKQL
jgi:hypothetical protein